MKDWKSIDLNLRNEIDVIFCDYDMDCLSAYEKRKMIFEYLSNKLTYDYETLEKIRTFKVGESTLHRSPVEELYSVIDNHKGICNAISQYYKLLLEKINVESYCVICDDGTDVKHQLNLVYDKDTNSYSFDDITSVIVKRGSVEEFFDYDLNFAYSVNQGAKRIMNDRYYFFILPEDYVNYLVKREKSLSPTLYVLPYNISSKKDIIKNKR